ncbi:tRNA pseudouridine(38-40) synthase TruA [Moheibacter sp.]|uniref:tRNA pseudouridine(38-40) synthase TruA n=1 Tax=Moheibacter sp. TaxID=1965316 RepID=UPI003C760E19
MRYFLELAYNGKDYFGWQRQPKQISVQEVLEKALSTLLRQPIEITGAGRTDTGVHAQKMFAHFDFEEILPQDLVHRLNSFLPKNIVIYKIHEMKSDAHARFDATDRTYHYFVQQGKDAFNYDFVWQIHFQLDIEKMNRAATMLLGKKDFSSFAKLHTDVKTHICEVKFAEWTQNKNELKFTITADRFLRNMVRAIVGTLVDVGKGKISLEEFNKIIAQKDRSFASGSAPAQGLYLADVVYPKSIFINE